MFNGLHSLPNNKPLTHDVMGFVASSSIGEYGVFVPRASVNVLHLPAHRSCAKFGFRSWTSPKAQVWGVGNGGMGGCVGIILGYE